MPAHSRGIRAVVRDVGPYATGVSARDAAPADVARVQAARGWLRANVPVIDVALAILFAAATTIGVWVELAGWHGQVTAPAGAYAIGIVASALLVVRRRMPVAVSIAAIVLVFGYHFLGYPGEAPGLVFFLAFYSVVAYGRTVWSVLVSTILTVVATSITTFPPNAVPWSSWAVLGPGLGLVWWSVALGTAARQRRIVTDERVRIAAIESEARVREGAAEERLRMARELHDVLAHTLAVIAVQSGVALDVLQSDPDQARKAMTAVRTLSKQAMPELRNALGALRGTAGGEPGLSSQGLPSQPLSPQPRLAQLGELVAQARATGLRVEFAPWTELVSLTPLLELTVYRIVQEALTNVIRHATATTVTVLVSESAGVIVVDVSDDGRGAGQTGIGEVGAGGFGLTGMRERAELAGGTLTAAPGSSSGFRVHAELPVGAA